MQQGKQGQREAEFLVLRVAEGGHSLRNVVVSRSLKRLGNGLTFRVPQKEPSSANTLIIVHGDPCQTVNLQNCKTNLSCFKP